jgi:hypothetical protein
VCRLRGDARLATERQAERDQRKRPGNCDPEREARERKAPPSDRCDGTQDTALRGGVSVALVGGGSRTEHAPCCVVPVAEAPVAVTVVLDVLLVLAEPTLACCVHAADE